jgi:hypothetical protein
VLRWMLSLPRHLSRESLKNFSRGFTRMNADQKQEKFLIRVFLRESAAKLAGVEGDGAPDAQLVDEG